MSLCACVYVQLWGGSSCRVVLEIISAWKTEKAKLIKREPIERDEEKNIHRVLTTIAIQRARFGVLRAGRAPRGKTVTVQLYAGGRDGRRAERVNLTPRVEAAAGGGTRRNPSIITRYISRKRGPRAFFRVRPTRRERHDGDRTDGCAWTRG